MDQVSAYTALAAGVPAWGTEHVKTDAELSYTVAFQLGLRLLALCETLLYVAFRLVRE